MRREPPKTERSAGAGAGQAVPSSRDLPFWAGGEESGAGEAVWP